MTDKELYSRLYWEGGLPDGSGYKGIGYQNFPAQLVVLDKILERKPETVLDIGSARGYLVKMLQQNGIRAHGVDISEYCYATRVTNTIRLCDISKDQLPFDSKSIDLGFSIAVLEHIEEADIPHVIKEIARVCRRAVIAPSFYDVGDPDKTHCFPPGVQIRMADGSVKPIEEIKVGDIILGERHGCLVHTSVRRTFRRKTDKLIRIKTNLGRSILCTPEHPFRTTSGWVKAENLKATDTLITTNAEHCVGGRGGEESLHTVEKVLATERIATMGTEVFNLETDTHNYIAEDFLVHNCTLKPKEWWEQMFATHAPGFPVEIIDKEEMEKGDLKFKQTAKVGPITVAGRYVDEDIATIQGKNGDRKIVLNIGSWIVQFRSTKHDCVINTDVHPELENYAIQWGSNYMVYKAPDTMPFPDNTVDAINCSHMLEHLTREEGLAFLKECQRVLKPGGIIRIAVPDAEKLALEYVCVYHNKPDDAEDDVKVLGRHKIYNVGAEQAEDAADILYRLLLENHKTIYDYKALANQLTKAGFGRASYKVFNQTESVPLFRSTYDMYPEISLYVEGHKSPSASTVTHPVPSKDEIKKLEDSVDELAGLGETIGAAKTPPPTVAAIAERIEKETTSMGVNAVKDYLAGKVAEGRLRL